MSSQIFEDNFKSSFETFSAIPGYVDGITNKRNQSFSVLNKGNKNMYNSVFTDLVPTNKKGFIVKKGTQFPDKLSKIDSYFVGNDTNTNSKCQDVCSKQDYCKAFTFDTKEKKCNLFNGVPNQMFGNADTISGYKGNLSFDFSKLNPNQKKHVEKRIGSQYLMKRFNITSPSPNTIENFDNYEVEGYMNNDITNCLLLKRGPIIVDMKLIIKTSNEDQSDSNKVKFIALQNGSDVVSNKVSLSEYSFEKDNLYKIPIQFDLNSKKFDGFRIKVADNSLKMTQLKLILIYEKQDIVLYNSQDDNWWKNNGPVIKIKNDTQYFNLNRKIDLDKLSIDEIDYVIGSNKSDEQKLMNVNTEKIDEIFSGKKWSIDFNLKINPNKIPKNKWSNLFIYGNNSRERSPGVWVWPNNYRKVHFRFRTNKNWNDGINFNLPNKTNEYMNIKIDFIQFKKYYIYTVYVDGKKVENKKMFGYLTPLKNRKMYIKNSFNGSTNIKGFYISNLTFTKEFKNTAIIDNAIDSNRKVMGYYADPKCIYNKVPDTEDVYNRNLEEHSGVQNDSIISESIDDQNQYGEQIADYNQQLANLKNDPSLNAKLSKNAKDINKLSTNESPTATDKKNTQALENKISGKSIIESYTNNVRNNTACYVVIILIMLIVLAFLIQ